MVNGDVGKWSGQNFSKIVWSYFIFQQWYQYYEKYDKEGDNQLNFEEMKKKLQTGGGYKCLFGAGLIGCTWAYDLVKAMGCEINFYCDNNKEEGLEVREGVRTISLDKLYSFKDDVLVFITVAHKDQKTIKTQLEKNGIRNIIVIDYLFMQTFMEDILKKNDRRLNEQFKYILDDKEYISRQFEYYLGYCPNLDNPKTFNEKLQWLKLYDRNPKYTQLVDKYEVKKYVANIIGEEYVIPTLGIYNSFEEIDFEKLPQQFVLKCTHGCGGVMVCKDKTGFDINIAKEVLHRKLKQNQYWYGREWPYKNVKPRIIAEQYLEEADTEDLVDYKVLCMNGTAKLAFTCTNRFGEGGLCVNFYDRYWNPMPFKRHYPRRRREVNKPTRYEEMLILSEKLSTGMRFVRVDFYFVKERIFIGEMTFYPGNGIEEFMPEEWDYKLGEMIQL